MKEKKGEKLDSPFTEQVEKQSRPKQRDARSSSMKH